MDDAPLQILLIEDNPGDARLIRELLADVRGTPFALACAGRLSTGLDRLVQGGIDAVLLDLSLPESRGLDTFLRTQACAEDVAIVVLTGLDDADLAVTAVQQGAEDYLVKGQVTSNSLARSLRHAVERARRRKAEARVRAAEEGFRIAREIQQRFFPAAAPRLPGFDVGGASYAAEATGGDYFDYIPMRDDCLGVVVGDVSGHGFGPALLMAETRAYLRALTLTQTDVGELVTRVNQFLFSDTAEDRFVTLLFGRIDPHTRTLVYTSAGHLDGYLLDASGQVKESLSSTGLPLGVDPDQDFATAPPVRLEPGDLVFLLTDGLIEACDPGGTLFGIHRALDVVRARRHDSAQEIVQSLHQAVLGYCQKAPLDDVTMIVAKVKPRP